MYGIVTIERKLRMLYHIVPPRLVGNELMPLTTLKEKDEALYNQHIQKYANRKETMEIRIEPLQCLWNDVVFLSPIHPSDLAQTFEQLGTRLIKRRFYQIDLSLLDLKRATLWKYEDGTKDMKDFIECTAENIALCATIPERAVEYYKRMLAAGKRKSMLMYAHVPHILYKGTIDISSVPIVEV
jgi:hypothetical protein